MKFVTAASVFLLSASAALAQAPASQPAPAKPAAKPSGPADQKQAAPATTCKGEAAAKKLAGAALASFLKKCQQDATATCNKSAEAKKLSGAAKTSHTKKCVSDAVGT